ncbi:hypothetical protein R3P38DRAFT_3226286 [Favolaschia claudopus]|uniref:Uncharacterized protein n=1 Tax=Favolaschia claudopus TaxID=2862362 RepID=A0AAV9ZUB2_9AGAR
MSLELEACFASFELRAETHISARAQSISLPPSEQPPTHAAKYPSVPVAAVVTRRISRPLLPLSSLIWALHAAVSPPQRIFCSHSVVSSPPLSRNPSVPSPTSSLLREQHASADYM